MSNHQDLETRIRRLEDRAQLRDLVAKYALAMDGRDFETLAALFAEDFSLRSRDGTMNLVGRKAVIDELRTRLAAQGPSNHVGHDHIVQFTDGDPDRATGVFTAHAELCSQGRALIAAIRYDDVYLRDSTTWRFASRVASYFYFLPVDQYAAALTGSLRVLVRAEPRPADYPESLPSWRAFYDKG